MRLGSEHDPERLDGAWWPRSLDLGVELAELAAMLPARLGGVVHVGYSHRRWGMAPRSIALRNGRQVSTCPFVEVADSQRVRLRFTTRRSLSLMVIPPALPAEAAEWAMAEAAAPNVRASAHALLAAAWARQLRSPT